MTTITNYVQAASIEMALQALADNKMSGRFLAGGTSLMPILNLLRYQPGVTHTLIDIKHIEGLRTIELQADELVIGAAVTLSELTKHQLVLEHAPVLVRVAKVIGSREIRNRATLGGNLCSGDPRADLLLPTMALLARLQFVHMDDPNVMGMSEFLAQGNRARQHAILTHIYIPIAKEVRWGYSRVAEKSMGRCNIAAMALVAGESGSLKEIGLVVGGEALWPQYFTGLHIGSGAKGSILTLAEKVVSEIAAGKVGWSDYRTATAVTVVYEALEELMNNEANA